MRALLEAVARRRCGSRCSPAFFGLMGGGVFGLPRVPTDRWGGLPLTIMLATFGIVLRLPALGAGGARPALDAAGDPHPVRDLRRADPRRAADLGAVHGARSCSRCSCRWASRPTCCCACWSASRCSRRPTWPRSCAAACRRSRRGRSRRPTSLGLTYWQTQRKIVLPQALAIVVPGIMNSFIAIFKDTSLVTIVSLYELTGALGTRAQLGRQLAAVQDRGLPLHRADLLRLLLRDVALQPVGREAARRAARRAREPRP